MLVSFPNRVWTELVKSTYVLLFYWVRTVMKCVLCVIPSMYIIIVQSVNLMASKPDKST